MPEIFPDVADFTPVIDGTIVFPPGVHTQCTPIAILLDLLIEEEERFNFTIAPVQDDRAIIVGTPDSATVNIVDGDRGNVQ